jgi:formiminoglutamase
MVDPDWPAASAWLKSQSSDPELVVAGVPWDAGGKGHRTPAALRATLSRFSTYHGESEMDLERLPVHDLGDWPISNGDRAAAEIEQRTIDLAGNPTYAFIGGDAAMTGAIANGLGLAGLGVLTVDARHRAAPSDPPANEAVVGSLIADGLAGDRISQLGVHSFSNPAAHRTICDEHGVSVFPMDTVDLWGIEETVTVALDQLARHCERIHVAIDLSVLDVAFAPASPASRPGGLTPRQLATAALQCGRHPLVHTAGFTGVDAAQDRDDLTLMNLATCFLSFAAGVTARVPSAAP